MESPETIVAYMHRKMHIKYLKHIHEKYGV